MTNQKNTKGEGFPEIKNQSVCREFFVGFCSGVASSFFVNNAHALVLMGPKIALLLDQCSQWVRPPPVIGCGAKRQGGSKRFCFGPLFYPKNP